MVKKLFKHEILYYARTFGLFLPLVVLFGIMTKVSFLFGSDETIVQLGLLTRLSFLFDGDKSIAELAQYVSATLLYLSCLALLIMSFFMSIVRFYKNMYTAEGYLTFTLPVTNAQHIFVKLISAFLTQVVCAVTVVLAVFIATFGDTLVELFTAFYELIGIAKDSIGIGNLIGFSVEVILLTIITPIFAMLLAYACVTVGQLAKKNRIVMAVVAYIVYYIATQIISTIFTAIVMILGGAGAFDGLLEWASNHTITALHMLFCIAIVFTAGIAAVFWTVTQKIMSKKLNLE